MCMYVVCICSVREWIQCMQVCCQSRTSYSSPPIPGGGSHISHLATPSLPRPPPMCNYALETNTPAYISSTHRQPRPHFLQFPPHCYTSMVATPTSSTLLLATPTSSALLVDTGYVSAESSPTLRTVWVRWFMPQCYNCSGC